MFQHDGVLAYFSTILRSYLYATSEARLIGSENLRHSRSISPIEYHLLLQVYVKYLESLNLALNRFIDASKYVVSLVDGILNIFVSILFPQNTTSFST